MKGLVRMGTLLKIYIHKSVLIMGHDLLYLFFEFLVDVSKCH